jgi:uracil-DNA glycosylase
MLNSALTVIKNNKNIHQDLWRWFTNGIIKYISYNKEHVVFVLWGSDAYNKLNLIDLDKHDAIITSHPSGLSANKPMKEYPAFNTFDSFGQVNKYLSKWNYKNIDKKLKIVNI